MSKVTSKKAQTTVTVPEETPQPVVEETPQPVTENNPGTSIQIGKGRTLHVRTPAPPAIAAQQNRLDAILTRHTTLMKRELSQQIGQQLNVETLTKLLQIVQKLDELEALAKTTSLAAQNVIA